MTNVSTGQVNCQILGLGRVGDGYGNVPPESFSRRLKLLIRRRLSPPTERRLKIAINGLLNWTRRITGQPSRPTACVTQASSGSLAVGDWVRVRSKLKIEATLNNWRQLRGCTFMPEMEQYCDTTQRVLKPLERFVDERDLRVKKAKGVVLLEGVMCQGTADFGRCDRSCLLFWREEWLEKTTVQ
jgi:hypothetical protein